MTKDEIINQLVAEARAKNGDAELLEEAARSDAGALCSYARLLGESNGLLRAALLVRSLGDAKLAG